MAESQGDIYVRKDVFYARISRIEELQQKTVSELREVRNELNSINAKFNSIGFIYSAAVMCFWIVLAVVTSTIMLSAAVLAFKKIFRPSVTLEDVKRIAQEITENTAKDVAERVANEIIARNLNGGK